MRQYHADGTSREAGIKPGGSKIMNTRARAALIAACLSAFIRLPAQPVVAQDTTIRILCSNGIRAAVEKLLPEYEHSMGRSMKVQFGASAVFKRSIEGGEPFDLAILTPPIIEDLIKQGKIAEGTGVDLASTGIGIAVRAGLPKPDVTTPEAIKQTLLRSKSIGYVKEGAGTPAIVNMLNSLGISEDVRPKTVFQPGAERSMASVAGGQIDVAFALISEILPAPGVQLAGPLPPEFQKRIIMSAGISSSTKNREAVSEIIKSLTSAAAAATIKTTGLDPIAKEK
jgi:molybdate transport system substrate-binding protein